MQNQAAMAYQQVAKKTEAPRDLESSLLSKSATSMQKIRDNWEITTHSEIEEVMMFNRKLWQVFMTSVTRDDSPLPKDIRENIANLGIFVMNHTREMTLEPDAKYLTALIGINRELALGLRAKAAVAQAPAA